MLKQRKLRRTVGALLLIAGGLLMWFAPAAAFGARSISGLVLMLAGIVLEIAGIALEHHDKNKRPGHASDL
ncbi:MAG: hypothetical protein HYU44_07095 [Betaproteobacteria bacterium]|nr:hypothetical protein [Betaproteobacteria bacterium]MBI2294425.1 hypothetical protein [Betaproteobacteria bacterium]MBI3055555.1 hypothetical protein [Betaproteobacteria bacterium]